MSGDVASILVAVAWGVCAIAYIRFMTGSRSAGENRADRPDPSRRGRPSKNKLDSDD